MKKLALVGAAAAVAAMGIAAPGVAGPGDNQNKYEDGSASRACGDGDTVTLTGPLKLWPPNHKFVDETVVATEGADVDPADDVLLTIRPRVDDIAGGDGGAQHDPDTNASEDGTIVGSGTGSATAAIALRAERSGKGEGRDYVLNWVATFDNGSKTCSSDEASSDPQKQPFVISVPHDMRGGADW